MNPEPTNGKHEGKILTVDDEEGIRDLLELVKMNANSSTTI